MNSLRFLLMLGLAGLATTLVRADPPALRLSYAGTIRDFSSVQLSAMPHLTIMAYDAHEKKNHAYSGIPIRDLLAEVGVPFGEKLRGRALRLVVLAKASDGYAVAYAVAEFDDNFSSRRILLVDRQDGAPNPPGIGPLRILAPGDKRPARWERMVQELDVIPVGN